MTADLPARIHAIRAELEAANPNGAEFVALTDPGDRTTAPAWIVDADDIEVRLPATYAAGKLATFIASAPDTVAKLLGAVEAALAEIDATDLETSEAQQADLAERIRTALTDALGGQL